jgi:phosphate transport system protein
MTNLDEKINQLKTDTLAMWELVIDQLKATRRIMVEFDNNVFAEIGSREKEIDLFELKINSLCETILALYTPVANNLRFVLAVLRINTDLERIGDYSRGISKMIHASQLPFNGDLNSSLKILEIFDTSIEMTSLAMEAFEKEDIKKAEKLIDMDSAIDKVNKKADKKLADLISKKPEKTINYLHIYVIIQRIERVGDQAKNIAEEIIFYINAKVLKHSKKKTTD